MKRKIYNNVVKVTKMIPKKGYSLAEANEMAIRLFDENTREKIGIFKHEDEIPTEILQRPGGRDGDRSYGWLTINVK